MTNAPVTSLDPALEFSPMSTIDKRDEIDRTASPQPLEQQ